MSSNVFADALAAGLTIVTPNKRLARALAARHDHARAQAGARGWEAARVLPWQPWLDTLWLDAVAAHALDRPLVTPHAAALLWDRIVTQRATLLDPRGAAERAAEAWRDFHAWRHPGERVDAWARAGIDDDAATFAHWAADYERELDERGLADHVTLADRLAAAAPHVSAWRGRHVVLAGFLETTPQQQRLLAALRAAGVTLDEVALPFARDGRCTRVEAATPAQELGLALSAARERLTSDPDAQVGIVVADLDERRDDVLALAEDLLCPELAERCAADAPRPYNVSLGRPLADVPLVACALALIGWPRAPLALADATATLRSPYLPGADAHWMRRAAVEMTWAKAGLREIDWPVLVSALRHVPGDGLGDAWRTLMPPPTTRQAPAAWANAWRAWLDALGWCRDRTLGSGEWQARDAFLRLLGEFATLGTVATTLRADEAVSALRAAARRTLFQPEAPAARLQILGLLEAAGLEFDALWVAGLSAEQWPPAASPAPLLPLAWQRERGMPRCDGPRALAYARTLTEVFARAADDVVVSHAVRVDGNECAPSALVAAWPCAAPPPLVPRRAVQIAEVRPTLLRHPDDVAPSLADGTVMHGGVDTVESQSACPFQAFARHRLQARGGDAPGAGLSLQERGTVLHRTLAAFWEDVRDHATLRALDDDALRVRIAEAVAAALVPYAARLAALPAPVAHAESARLAATLHAWLTSVERERAPFTVERTEAKMQLALGGLVLRFRVDRVDRLAEGGLAIIDYKSGRAPSPGRWFAERPAGTQVGLYALAQRAAAPDEPIAAALYAVLKAGAVKVCGLAKDDGIVPGASVLPTRNVPLATWDDVLPTWQASYGALARAFAEGRAAVAPRPDACRQCELDALCRIQRLDGSDAEEGGDAE
ncbi:MAG: PD-(D/E)XK nuclease family protein [Burkholderiales bacterium]